MPISNGVSIVLRWPVAITVACAAVVTATVATVRAAPPLAMTGPPPEATMSTTPSSPGGKNLLWNGSFTGRALRPWSVGFDSPRNGQVLAPGASGRPAGEAGGGAGNLAGAGELCLAIERPGTHRYDVVVRQGPLALEAGHQYQLRFRTHASAPTRLRARLSHIGTPATEYWAAIVASRLAADTYSATYAAAADQDNVELAFELGGDLAGGAPLTVCIGDVQLNDPRFEVPAERAAPRPPRVAVNQLGYLPGHAKIATVAVDVLAGAAKVAGGSSPPISTGTVTATATGIAPGIKWQLFDHAGNAVAAGNTRALGQDTASGERVHRSTSRRSPPRARVSSCASARTRACPFEIGADVYHRLKYDALAFFYLQRSGVAIKMPYAGSPAYERARRALRATRASPARPRRSATTAWTSAAAGTTRAITASTWSTAASRSGRLHNQYEALTRFGSDRRPTSPTAR